MLRFLSLGMVALLVSGNAYADSPEAVAERCAKKVEQVVVRATNAAREETRECVRQINALQEQGRHEAAAELARECIRKATARTENAAEYVTELCDRCIDHLLDLDAPQLARRIHNLCKEAIETLRAILQRERNAILDALEDY